jgi:ABC-2 type transport system ATP-binding protein
VLSARPDGRVLESPIVTGEKVDLAIATLGLTKVYGDRVAVADLDLEVRRGEVFGFLGQNGAGKTTTIRMLLGLVRPTRGDVNLFGRPLSSNRLEVLDRVGSLVEGPSFYPFLSAEKNLVLIGAATRGKNGLSGSRLVDRARECLDRVGLLDRKDDLYKGYSRGMKQRLGIALAMLHRPELIVLDEPLNGLDPPAIVRIRALIRDLAGKEGATVFVSSHLLHEVEITCDRVAIIDRGRLLAKGSVADLLRPEHDVIEVEADDLEAAGKLARELPFVKKSWIEDGSHEARTRRVASLAARAERPDSGRDEVTIVPGRAAGERILVIELELGHAAELNAALVRAGRAISSLAHRRRTLEDLFHTRIAEARAPGSDTVAEAARRG